MANFFLYVTFIMAISIPIIAIIAELSSKTPNSIFHSVIRSVICLGCIIFLSNVMGAGYKVTTSHFMTISMIFFTSCLQLYLEFHNLNFDKFLSDKDKETDYTHHDNIH